MQKYKLTTLLILIILFKTSLLLGGTDQNIWEKFIDQPNKANYELCRKMVNDSLYGPYDENTYGEKINTPTQLYLIDNWDLYGKFLKLVRKINPYAVELAVQLYPLTDASTTVDLFASVGTIIKIEPVFFLSVLKKYEVTNKYVIEGMATGKPLEKFVDNIEGQIAENKERIRALETVKKEDLIELRNQCITILKRRLIRLNKIKQELSQGAQAQ